jgi:hypothetical protein
VWVGRGRGEHAKGEVGENRVGVVVRGGEEGGRLVDTAVRDGTRTDVSC